MTVRKKTEIQIGDKFNKLTVLGFLKKNIKHGHKSYVSVVCDCGIIKDIRHDHLYSGRTKSCGCYVKTKEYHDSRLDWQKDSPYLLPKGESAKRALYYDYQKTARYRNYEFSLSIEDFSLITSQNCHYCGCEPSQSKQGRQSKSRYLYNGIDRLNNDIGYQINNCVASCGWCNKAKGQLSYQEFINKIKKVHNHSVKKKAVQHKGKAVYFDVDMTLVMWHAVEEGKADPSELITFKNPTYVGSSPYASTNMLQYQEFFYLVPHYRHIEDLKKHYDAGDTVMVHSAGGAEWAQTVVDTLGLTPYVSYCLTKPDVIYDDLPIKEWTPHHIRYREFKSKVKGKDEKEN